jgi:hypothetical protein
VLDHEAADRRQRLAARDEARPRVVVGDQVLVAMAILLLGVGDAVELVGQRPQALGEEAQALDLDRQLAGLGLEERALGADDVAEVELLEVVVGSAPIASTLTAAGSGRSRPARSRSWPCP